MRANVVENKVPYQNENLSWFEQYSLLLRLLVTDYRSAAPFLLLIGLVLPMGFLWILSKYVGVGEDSLWLLAGNIVMAVSFGSVSFATQRTALMKVEGELDYYGSLAVKKSAFILALFSESIIFAFPAMLGSMVMGNILLNIPWSTLVLGIPIAILAASSLTIVGSTIGSYAKNMVHFAIFSYLPYLVVTFFSPVLLPIVELPFLLKITSYVLPTGQAALALTDVFNGNFNLHFWALVLGLFAWLIFSFLIAFKKLDWRTV